MGNEHKIRDGEGYTYSQGPWGFNLELDRQTVKLTYPFKVTTAKVSGSLVAYVEPGTVNNFVPKIGSTYLDASTRPTLSINAANKYIIALKITYSTATFFPHACEVVALTDDSVMEPNDTYGYLQLASVNVVSDGGTLKVTAVNQFIFSSQIVVRAKGGTGTALWTFSSR